MDDHGDLSYETHMKAIEIVDLPTEHGDFPTSLCGCLPEGLYLLVGGLENDVLWLSIQLGMSSSQLTNSYSSEG